MSSCLDDFPSADALRVYNDAAFRIAIDLHMDTYPEDNWSHLKRNLDYAEQTELTRTVIRVRFAGLVRHIQERRIKITPEILNYFHDEWKQRILEAICLAQVGMRGVR